MLFGRISRYTVFPTLIVVSLVAILTACGGSSGSGSGSGQSYSGPGSKWDYTLNSNATFSVTRRADLVSPVDLTVNGTYTRPASGFLLMTVTSASGTDAPSPGDTAWALEVPGYALLLNPVQSTSDQLIAMVVSGECPSADVDANWVLVKKDAGAAANDPGRDFFGSFNYAVGTGSPSLPSRFDLAGFTDQGANALTDGACSGGIMSVSDAVMYLTSNGGAIVHIGTTTPGDETDDQFIFALSQKAITSLANTDADYAGILFDDNQSSGAKISPVALSCSGGTCTGNIVTDVATGAVSADSVTITLSTPDALEPGIVTGTIDSSDPGSVTGNLACMADINALNTGKKVISCVGQSPGDTTQMFNVLFVSK